MKVITIKQPWASLIAEGEKEYEFRTWNTKYRGEIYIHAGKGMNRQAMELFKDEIKDFPSGCIIAKATLADTIKIDDKVKEDLKQKNYKVYKNVIESKEKEYYGFLIKNVEKIKPIPIKGKLSLWNYEDSNED